jgi:hypothetical protein
LDKEKNQCIREKTGVQNIVQEIKQYQKKWLNHVERMDRNRMPRQALRYRTEGRWNGQRTDGGTSSTLRIKEQENPLTNMMNNFETFYTPTEFQEVIDFVVFFTEEEGTKRKQQRSLWSWIPAAARSQRFVSLFTE